MQKEDLLTDTIFDPCNFSLDYTFKGWFFWVRWLERIDIFYIYQMLI
jgi:hypothetical protein